MCAALFRAKELLRHIGAQVPTSARNPRWATAWKTCNTDRPERALCGGGVIGAMFGPCWARSGCRIQRQEVCRSSNINFPGSFPDFHVPNWKQLRSSRPPTLAWRRRTNESLDKRIYEVRGRIIDMTWRCEVERQVPAWDKIAEG